MKNIGERIYLYRERCRLSQLEFAEMLGVSRQAVSKWETGTSVPELEKLIKMAQIFEIDLDSLILGKEGADSDMTLPTEKATSQNAKTSVDADEGSVSMGQKESFAAKTIMGCFFLIMGIALSVFFLFWAPLFGLLLLLPFALCALFCLGRFRHAALWCSQAWFVFASAYLCYGSGTRWTLVLEPSFYSPNTNELVMLFAYAELALLVIFVFLTVRAFRNHHFDHSRRTNTILAVLCGVMLVMSFCSDRLLSAVCLYLLCQGDQLQYMYFLASMGDGFAILQLALDCIFAGAFTVCLMPTVHWIKKVWNRHTRA